MAHSPCDSVLVSIIMPLYNAERFVTAALTSLLTESTIPLEIIVVNDGSSDRSLQAVQKINDARLKVVTNEGHGIAAALNTGLAIAQGEIIMRCDADDLYPAQRLRYQVKWLNQHPEFGAVCGGYTAIGPKGVTVTRLGPEESAEITEELRNGTTRTHFCTYAIRAEVLRQLGGFRHYFTTAEDVDFQLRLGEVCRVWYLPDSYYFYRLHSASITHTKGSVEREFFDAIAREFQKQRRTLGKDDLDRGYPPLPPSRQGKPFTAAQHIQSFLLGEAWRIYREGQRLQAICTGIRSALAVPSSLSTWRSLVMLIVKSMSGENRLVVWLMPRS